jgi:hypothetical protein
MWGWVGLLAGAGVLLADLEVWDRRWNRRLAWRIFPMPTSRQVPE